jgi:hypothetical protein
MNFLASLVRRQQPTARASSKTGPTLIDPKDYQFVGGGVSNTTRVSTSTKSPQKNW